MKIRFESHLKEMGIKRCLFRLPKIEKFWSGKIITIGSPLLYMVIDIRKNWIKDMVTGGVE